jgi:cell envelope opacity-associated protein A
MIQQHDFKPRQSHDRGLVATVLARFGARHQLLLFATALMLVAVVIPGWRLQRLLPSPLTSLQEHALIVQPRTDLDIQFHRADSAETEAASLRWQTIKVRSGETLATIFRREQLDLGEMHQMLHIALVADTVRK